MSRVGRWGSKNEKESKQKYQTKKCNLQIFPLCRNEFFYHDTQISWHNSVFPPAAAVWPKYQHVGAEKNVCHLTSAIFNGIFLKELLELWLQFTEVSS